MHLVSAVLFATTLQTLASATVSQRVYGRAENASAEFDCAYFADLTTGYEYALNTWVDIPLSGECLCVFALPDFVATSPATAPALALGANATELVTDLEDLIIYASTVMSCEYPDQALPACSPSNVCDFTCQNGFTASPPSYPTDCVCEAPNKICNGVCAAACPSPNPKKRRVELQDRRDLCAGTGLTACGVYGFDSTDAWECIDTKADLESCGGCTVPLGRSLASGTDCTALPGVMDVACLSGSCAVQRCQPGLAVAPDGASCTPANPSFVEGNVLAAAYGLEHVPLKKRTLDY